MNGTPYWGKQTFQDIRDINDLPHTELTLDKIKDLSKSSGLSYDIKDTYTLFLALANLDFLFIIEGETLFTTWCRDIRFNYRDKKVFIPYYSYKVEDLEFSREVAENDFLDTTDNKNIKIRHEFKLESILLEDRNTGIVKTQIDLYDYINKIKYKLNIPKLPYLSTETFSLADLSNRYIESAYIKVDNTDSDDWKKYLKVDTRGSKKKEHKIRLKEGLNLYAEGYNDLTYNDVRHYEYSELHEGSRMVADEIKPYWLRMYEFEAYLYCIFAQELEVEEKEYKEPFAKLGVSERFLTYTENKKPLVLKHYYKNEITLRRKSYERYRA